MVDFEHRCVCSVCGVVYFGVYDPSFKDDCCDSCSFNILKGQVVDNG